MLSLLHEATQEHWATPLVWPLADPGLWPARGPGIADHVPGARAVHRWFYTIYYMGTVYDHGS